MGWDGMGRAGLMARMRWLGGAEKERMQGIR